MKQTSQRSLLFRQNVNRTEAEWVHFLDGYRQCAFTSAGFWAGERGGDEGLARTRGGYVADQGARAAKMKSAPGPGTTDLGYSTTPHPTKGVRPRARFRRGCTAGSASRRSRRSRSCTRGSSTATSPRATSGERAAGSRLSTSMPRCPMRRRRVAGGASAPTPTSRPRWRARGGFPSSRTCTRLRCCFWSIARRDNATASTPYCANVCAPRQPTDRGLRWTWLRDYELVNLPIIDSVQ